MRKLLILFIFSLFFSLGAASVNSSALSEKNIYKKIEKNLRKQKKYFSIRCPKNAAAGSGRRASRTVLAFKKIERGLRSRSPKKYYTILHNITESNDRNYTTDDCDYLFANIKALYTAYQNGRLYFVAKYFETARQTKKVNKKIETIAEKITGQTEDTEKQIRLAMQYVADHVSYDHRPKKFNSSAYCGLFQKRTVCNGYAMIMYKLLNQMGIPCKFITGYGYFNGEKVLHAWNIVKIDSKWYNIDATNDDPDQGEGKYSYNFYLKSDKALKKTHKKLAFLRTEKFKRKYPMSRVNYKYNLDDDDENQNGNQNEDENENENQSESQNGNQNENQNESGENSATPGSNPDFANGYFENPEDLWNELLEWLEHI